MSDSSHDLVVIGAGITGLIAARQALQGGLSTALMECQMFGGLVINVNELDGETRGSGADLASELMTAVCDLGGENLQAAATAVASEAETLVVTSDAGTHRARAVIVASGARLKRLGVPGEAEFEHKGVSQCADCDGPLYANQDVVVVGGGDSTVQATLVLAKFCRQVHLVHRGDRFRAQPHLVDAIAARKNILIHWNRTVQAVLGDKSVHAVRVLNTKDGSAGEISCTGVFAYVGLEPTCEFVPAAVGRDAKGFLLTDAALRTGMRGLFAAGAVRSGYGGLLGHSMAEGVSAAQGAKAFVSA